MIRRSLRITPTRTFNYPGHLNRSVRHSSTVFLGQETVELKFDVVHAQPRSSEQKLVLCHGL